MQYIYILSQEMWSVLGVEDQGELCWQFSDAEGGSGQAPYPGAAAGLLVPASALIG